MQFSSVPVAASPLVGEDNVDAASSARARAAQGERVSRLVDSGSGTGDGRGVDSTSANQQGGAAAGVTGSVPIPVATSSEPSNRQPSSLQQSLSYWDQHEKAPSERGEAVSYKVAGTNGPSVLEVEQPTPEPAPEPEQPVAASQPGQPVASAPVQTSAATAQQPTAPNDASMAAAATATPRTTAPLQSPVVPSPAKTAAPKPRRSVSSVSAGAVGIGQSTSHRSGRGTRRKRQLHVPESLLPHLNQLHKMFPKAIAEDLMKTNNNMQRTIENILNGLESEIPAVSRRTPEAVDESATQRRQLLAVQNRLLSQQNSLRAAVATSEEEREKHREEAHSYILQLQSFGCFSIVARFRIRMLFRIHRSELKREVQGLCLARIASTLESIESRLKLQEVEYTAEDEAWMTPSSVFKQAEDISSLWRKIKLLDAHFMKYDTVLRQQIREETRRLEFAERSKTILAIIAQTELQKVNGSDAQEHDAAGGLIHHVWHDERQRIFNELILDQRTKEGDFIQNLASLVNGQQASGTTSSRRSGTDPDSIKATIQHLVEVMARDHNLVGSEQQVAILRLYVHRAVFPLIADSCFWFASEDSDTDEEYIRYKDTVFRKQLQLLLPKSQVQVGIDPKFCRPPKEIDALFEDEEESPYSNACKILRQLTYLVVPSDMLYCLWKVGRTIYELAEGYAEANGTRAIDEAEARGEDVTARREKASRQSNKEGIGADDFVPIFLYVTIHAELPTPFQICTCIKRFASDTERNSEAGYYLTCFEGALMHITDTDHGISAAREDAAEAAGAQQEGEQQGGVNAAAGLSARISEIGAGNSPEHDSTRGDEGGAENTATITASDIWDD